MKLSSYLKEKNITQEQFAESIGVARFTLQRYLHKGRMPPPDVMCAIHKSTDGEVTPNDFYQLNSGGKIRKVKPKKKAKRK